MWRQPRASCTELCASGIFYVWLQHSHFCHTGFRETFEISTITVSISENDGRFFFLRRELCGLLLLVLQPAIKQHCTLSVMLRLQASQVALRITATLLYYHILWLSPARKPFQNVFILSFRTHLDSLSLLHKIHSDYNEYGLSISIISL